MVAGPVGISIARESRPRLPQPAEHGHVVDRFLGEGPRGCRHHGYTSQVRKHDDGVQPRLWGGYEQPSGNPTAGYRLATHANGYGCHKKASVGTNEERRLVDDSCEGEGIDWWDRGSEDG
jgi:hypothetical protein